MGLKNAYLKGVLAEVERRDAGEPEFIQAVTEVLESLEPVEARDREAEHRRPDCRAGAVHPVPGAVGGRQWQRAGQPRLPGRVQLGDRALQGRPAAAPDRLHLGYQVPRLRAVL